MTIEEKLQHLMQYSMEEARKKYDGVLLEYTNTMEEIFQEYQENKKRQENLEIKSESEHLIRENNKRFSEEQVKLRRTLSSMQEELKEKLFVDMKDRLARFAESSDYQRLLVRQLKEAIAFARGEEVILYIDPSDAERKTSLEVEAGAPITVSSYSFMGGTRAVIPERNILIDNSFETKLAEAREKFKLRGGTAYE